MTVLAQLPPTAAGKITTALLQRGELWSPAPGLIGMRGELLRTFRLVRREVAHLAARETDDEWLAPPAVSLQTLRRAEYFSSFPQWLTAASHLRDEPVALERVARAEDPASAVGGALAPPAAALPPAVCYHVFDRLRDAALEPSPKLLTAEGTCWRHEGDRMGPLERAWAFTMREVVCLGAASDVEAFRSRLLGRGIALAEALGLEYRVEEATDPFFAPTARGKALLQTVKGLKQELLLSLGDDRWVAAASFNRHETFFGDAFGIRLASGDPASTGCAAFGLERWLLAVLVLHGGVPDLRGTRSLRDHHSTGSFSSPSGTSAASHEVGR